MTIITHPKKHKIKLRPGRIIKMRLELTFVIARVLVRISKTRNRMHVGIGDWDMRNKSAPNHSEIAGRIVRCNRTFVTKEQLHELPADTGDEYG